jgi:hypothetical protein
MREWVRGRHRIAREREDRATTQVVLGAMRPGMLWVDKEGDRLRLIAENSDQHSDIVEQLARATEPRRLEQGDGGATNR